MHGAGQRRIGIEIERNMAEIDTAPVRQLAAVKAQCNNRTALRIGRQAGIFQRQWRKIYFAGGGIPQRVPFSPIGREFTSKALDNTHRLFHFAPLGRELHHRHRRNGAQIMRPQQADQPFGQLRQIVVKLPRSRPIRKAKPSNRRSTYGSRAPALSRLSIAACSG